jgi:hypothetical protein
LVANQNHVPSGANPEKASCCLYSTVSIVPRWLSRYLAMEPVDITAQNAFNSPLLRLPQELRDMIYSFVLSQDICIARIGEGAVIKCESKRHTSKNIVRPLHRTNNLLALLSVCRQVSHEISSEFVFKQIRFSFRQIMPPTRTHPMFAHHTLFHLNEAQRACITTVTLETFQFLSMVDNWERCIARDASGLRAFLKLLPVLKHIELVGYQRGFHRKSMTRKTVHPVHPSTKESPFVSAIRKSRPGITVTLREVDRLTPSYHDGNSNDWLCDLP